MLEKIKIDSFKLLVPRNQVTYIDPGFCEKYQRMYPDTGYIEDYTNLDKFKVHEKDGIKTRIALFHAKEGKQSQDYIVFQCNSKMLKEKYLDGITSKTYEILYDYLMKLKIAFTPLESFMHSKATDIDFCYDEQVEPEEMTEAIGQVYKRVKPTCHKYVGKPFRKKDNIGIQFNKREKATPAKPFCKIYHKTIELDNHSFEFANAHLKNVNYENIGRLEWQLKNTNHRKSLHLRSQTFHDFLHPNRKEFEKLESALFNAIPKYVIKMKLLQDFEELTPADQHFLMMINIIINQGGDRQLIFDTLQNFPDRMTRKRRRDKLIQLLDKIENQHRLISNEKTMSFLRKLRLDL